MQKGLNIKEEIINKRPGVHYISNQLEDKLKEILRELHQENIFNQYGMSYTYRCDEDYISLVIHKEINY